jgi:hypothetical protein
MLCIYTNSIDPLIIGGFIYTQYFDIYRYTI